ncbi:MAG: hypothetical protein HOV81_25355 [Kofleriaceae bacterium]|nr:hypothetical protein [Kofleriaceae bacterium]
MLLLDMLVLDELEELGWDAVVVAATIGGTPASRFSVPAESCCILASRRASV